jgi:D-alanine-D-alanine ligase-like ATP-grasp enzyme
VPSASRKEGRWVLGGAEPKAISAAEVLKEGRPEALEAVEPHGAVDRRSIDVVFPVLHGPYGEDGTVQGCSSSPMCRT